MNDDDISELILRASAYLDGELSADEMTRAEADPAVMAEVEAMRGLQEQLADVDPPDDDTRERAIAAALDEFDLLHGAGAAAAAEPTPAPSPDRSPNPSPNVVPFRPRPAYTRWLTAAAAVVGIGVLGAVIAGTQGGSDDEQAADGGAATATAAASATAEETMRIESAPMESAAAAEFGAAEATAADEAPMEIMETAQAESATATASEPAEGGGSDPVTTTEPPASTTTTVPEVEPPVSTVTPPTVPEDLGDIVVDSNNLLEVGQQLLDQYAAGELPNTPETACEFGTYVVLSWAQYDVDGALRPALIAGHPELREVGAFDPDTCEAFDIVVP